MPVPKANQRAVNKYVKANYDRINVTMPKGRKAIIQDHAAAVGESVNAYINGALDDRMAQEAAGEAGIVSIPPDILKAATAAAEASGEGLAEFISRAILAAAPTPGGISEG